MDWWVQMSLKPNLYALQRDNGYWAGSLDKLHERGQLLSCSSADKLRNFLCCVPSLSLAFWRKDLAHGLKWNWRIRRSGSHGSLQHSSITQTRHLWVSILLSGNSSAPRWNNLSGCQTADGSTNPAQVTAYFPQTIFVFVFINSITF